MEKKELCLYEIENEYIEYLLKFEPKVMYPKEDRPYVGVLLQIGGMNYYAPLTSQIEKYSYATSNTLECYAIKEYAKDNCESKTAYLLFGNMIPIGKQVKINIRRIRGITGYDGLLLKQSLVLKNTKERNRILKKADKIYKLRYKIPMLHNNCVDFKYLEYCAKCYDYALENNIEMNDIFIDIVKENSNFEDFKKNYI